MKKNSRKFKQGAASFYIVAFSTLILIVIAMSFASIIISEITRSSNDDLAQSAYDSALAGVEDAKLAYYNYQRCIDQYASDSTPNNDSTLTCGEIIHIMEHGWAEDNCDMVAQILGRSTSEDGVLIQETSSGDNKMQQYYTCVKMQTNLNDVRTTLSSSNPTRVIRANLEDTDAVNTIKVSWSSTSDNTRFNFSNFYSGDVKFRSANDANIANPPTISVGIIQTGGSFYLDDFNKVATSRDESGNTIYKTNRSTIYLVPTDNSSYASQNRTPNNHIGSCKKPSNKNTSCTANDYINWITAEQVTKSNDQTVKNLPYAVYCPKDPDSDFLCSATLQVPRPYGDEGRNDESFMVVLSLPYGQPSTDIAVEFCNDTEGCTTRVLADGTVSTDGIIKTAAQVRIDSTGRANDLYRRIEARIETNDIYFPYPQYALELLGGTSSGNLLRKNFGVACEYDFDPTCSD